MELYPNNILHQLIQIAKRAVDDIRLNEDWRTHQLAQKVLGDVRNIHVTLLDTADYFDKHPIKEVCICAAVKTAEGEIYRGHRHCDCIQAMGEHKKPSDRPEDQGFITSRNRYVTRSEGLSLQLAAGIKSASLDDYYSSELFSEDLY